MTTYRVELTAYLEATHTIEIEADDEQDAEQYAIEQAPADQKYWTVLPSPAATRVSVFSCEECVSDDDDDDGTSGQDRDSYSDTQDRDSYTITDLKPL